MSAIRCSPKGRSRFAMAVFCGGLAVWPIYAAAQAAAGDASTQQSVPDFSGFWQHGVTQITFHPPPEGGPGPVIDVQDIACTPNCPGRPSGRHFIGDPSNPVLLPLAARAVQAMGDRWRAGEIVNAATELCAPSGVPHVLTLFGAVQILQTPDVVTILYQRDHQVRFGYMNREHTVDPAPSWYGESIGHYEGDTLVVDTIGLNDKSIIDRFGAPQTETTHVVERYRVIDGGNALLVHVTVDDPNIFAMPWSGTITYIRNDNISVLLEIVCAENNRIAVAGEFYPIPMAGPGEPHF